MGHAVLFAGHLTHYCRPTTRGGTANAQGKGSGCGSWVVLILSLSHAGSLEAGNRANLVLWCMSKAKLAAPGV
eukprot:4352860-Amphidinium_carterae.1